MRTAIHLSTRSPTAAEVTPLYLEAEFYKESEIAVIPESIRQTSRWYCAREADGTLVGMGRVMTDWVRVACIYDVIIAKHRRGQGIGKRLMQEIIRDLTAVPIRIIHLWPTKGNAGFYERLGFQALESDQPVMKFDNKQQFAEAARSVPVDPS